MTIKSSLIAAAAISVLLVPAAQAQVVGEAGVNYQHSIENTPGPNLRLNDWQVEGAARYDFGQVGASVDGQITDVSGDVPHAADYAFTAHLNTHAAADSILGGFAGVDAGKGLTFWGVGLEGQTKLTGKDSLYGQLGYGSSDDLGNPDIWAGRVDLRHFYTPNVKVQGSVGYLNADTQLGSFDSWTVGVEGEYQFAGTPFSVRAGYDYAVADKFDTHSNAFRVGVRYTFGAPTLQARNDAGADLGTLRDLFGRAIGF